MQKINIAIPELPTSTGVRQLPKSKLLQNIEMLAAYTAKHRELSAAHHFLYDLRCPADGAPKFVVMGINPGETAEDWTTAPTPTEETSRYDFHDEVGGGRSSIRWTKAARFFLDGSDYVLGELFAWSSADGRQFKERFGDLGMSKHLPLCTALNLDLIEAYQPKAVVFAGIGSAKLAATLFNLRHVVTYAPNGKRLVEHYTDGNRPWLFTRHWTAAFGFSNADRELTRNYIRASVGEGGMVPLR